MDIQINESEKKEILDSFYQTLLNTDERLLLLDYDGTLAPFRVSRDKAFPYPGVRDALNKLLEGKHSRIVIITGRWTKDLIPILGLTEIPEIWGSHGIERLKTDGSYEVPQFNEKQLAALAEAKEWIDDNELGDRCEEKPGCLALHWRGLGTDTKRDLHDKVSTAWSVISQNTDLLVHDFDGGLELRVAGFNKGNAIKAILSESANSPVSAYLGDDLTDEDAFKAILGKGLGILVRDEFRPTAASVWIRPPQELLRFLDEWDRAAKK